MARKSKFKISKIKVERDRRGFIVRVFNPHGNKTKANVVQRGDFTGFTALTPGGRVITRARSDKTIIKKLLKLGYKGIQFLD